MVEAIRTTYHVLPRYAFPDIVDVMLVAEGLTRKVNGRILFRDVSFSLDAGETLVVRAPSGAGKTLFLRLLAWLDPLQTGHVALHGRSPQDWGAPEWRTRVTYVAQRSPKLTGTAEEWLGAMSQLASRRSRSEIDAVSLAEDWGLARDLWQQPFVGLSGGEQQRVALAVALSRQPEVLLLDEPTSALDLAVAEAVEATLRQRSKVWVTHDAVQAERLGGRVVELVT